jgi:dinuclear metal center YbgI/SA1388 family protein
MKLFEIIEAIEKVAPPSLQEDYDNSGLLVGSSQTEVKKALLTLDTTEAVIEEAIAEGCDLIISHHPIVFKGIKRLNGSNYVERVVMSAIKNNIAIYACHTNLDNVLKHGVNSKIATKLGLINTQVLKPLQQALMKLTVFTPHSHADAVREALFAGGAGHVGNYDECSFNVNGIGTFRGGENTNPVIGNRGERTSLEEQRIEVLLPKNRFQQVMRSLRIAHPYEEIAYYSVDLANAWQDAGSGIVGVLEKPIQGEHFPAYVKSCLGAEVIRFTAPLIKNALQSGADAYITGDIKYHEFFDAENRMMICDPGHYETEQYTIELFAEILSEKFPNFATRFSHTYTNPIQYHY